MSDINVITATQVIDVDITPQTIEVPIQHLIVDSLTLETTVVTDQISISLEQASESVSVTNAGPPGPRGYSSRPTNPAQAAFYDATSLEEKTIDYVGGLPSVVKYYEVNVLMYESTITYVGGLPSMVTLVRQSDNAAFEKEIVYLSGLPISVEWRAV